MAFTFNSLQLYLFNVCMCVWAHVQKSKDNLKCEPVIFYIEYF